MIDELKSLRQRVHSLYTERDEARAERDKLHGELEVQREACVAAHEDAAAELSRAHKAVKRADAAEANYKRLEEGCYKTEDEVCQTLGKVLGYPWFKDDQKNFPNATADDGVCVGEHVAGSIASEAAKRITNLVNVVDALKAEALELLEAAEPPSEVSLDEHNAWVDRCNAFIAKHGGKTDD